MAIVLSNIGTQVAEAAHSLLCSHSNAQVESGAMTPVGPSGARVDGRYWDHRWGPTQGPGEKVADSVQRASVGLQRFE